MKSVFAIATFMLSASALRVKDSEEGDSLAETTTALTINTLQQGTGELCQTDQTAAVHYTGSLKTDGSVFDSSIPRGEPIKFKIGDYRVIKCWEQAILQLHVGEKADITCPSDLAYGKRSMPKIPANSVLNFNVEVVSCQAEE